MSEEYVHLSLEQYHKLKDLEAEEIIELREENDELQEWKEEILAGKIPVIKSVHNIIWYLTESQKEIVDRYNGIINQRDKKIESQEGLIDELCKKNINNFSLWGCIKYKLGGK